MIEYFHFSTSKIILEYSVSKHIYFTNSLIIFSFGTTILVVKFKSTNAYSIVEEPKCLLA